MIIFSYIIPIITCIILLIFYRKETVWWEYLILFLPSFLGTLTIQKIIEYKNILDYQWNSKIIKSVKHYDEWDEWIHRTCTQTYKVGKHTRTRTYDCSYRKVHNEYWVSVDYDGNEKEIERKTFEYFKNLWKTPVKFIDCHRNFFRKDGDAQEYLWDKKECNSLTYSNRVSYKNYFQSSHSLYSIKNSDNNRLVYDYPEDSRKGNLGFWEYDQNPVIGLKISNKEEREFRYTNASFGKDLRVFLLVWNSDSIQEDIWKDQRKYWKGGNQNELIICLGLKNKKKISWVNTFSWSEEPYMEVKLKRFLLKEKELNIHRLLEKIKELKKEGTWIPRNFNDYSYIEPEIYGYQYWIIFSLTILLNILISILIINKV